MKGRALTLVLVALLAPAAHATDAFEIQVYDSDINAPWTPGVELHLNWVTLGRDTPAYRGAVPTDQLVHMTLEPALGITDFWELGCYIQGAWDPKGAGGGDAWFGGAKLRSKFVVPRTVSDIFDLGINFEVSWVPHRFEESPWGSEIRPILGVRYGGFELHVNPILSFGWSGEKVGVPDFEPCGKVMWDTTLGFGVGVEYYTGLGKIDHIPAFEKQEHAVFIAFDLIDGPIELNAAVGRGLTEASNPWTLKAIIGKSF
ncbi:MAG TPA: hypothetical protein VFF73_10285 [Planctomycetota bacterium]|nr:hypothetical protein [Planctomycetota bacterium]